MDLPMSEPGESTILRALFEESPTGLVVVARDGDMRMVNRALREKTAVECSWRTEEPCGGNGRREGERPFRNRDRDGCASCSARAVCIPFALRRLASRCFDWEVGRECRVSLPLPVDGEPRADEVRAVVAPFLTDGESLAVVAVDLDEIDDERSPGPDGTRSRDSEHLLHGIVGRHPKMNQLFETIRQVGPLDVPVLIEGESGTGKEMTATALHRESSRSSRNLIPVNCAALAEGVLESELFGHVRGAFSGAVRDKKGRFELAHGGTLFLDEVGELSPAVQVKLLRVLQDGRFERVGGETSISPDVRVVCATHRNLESEVARGRFREDLYYRICVIKIAVPPLRERPADIPLLSERLLEKAAEQLGLPMAQLSPRATKRLVQHSWPGNIRELENVLRHGLIRSRGGVIEPGDLPRSISDAEKPAGAAEGQGRVSLERVREALVRARGNKSRAAKILGVGRATLYRYLKREEARV